MFSDYKGSSSYYDTYHRKDDHNIATSNRLQLTYPFNAPSCSKFLHSHMEESKQNISLSKNHPFSSTMTHLSKLEMNGHLSPQYGMKKEWDKSYKDVSKSKNVKSSKAIKFLNQFDHEYGVNKTYTKNSDDYKDFDSKKENLKTITMSLDYKSTLKDLIPCFKSENHKVNETCGDIFHKNSKSSKSQKRINIEMDESYSLLRPQTPKSQYKPAKSYKALTDIISETNIFSKGKQQKDIPNFLRSPKRYNTAKVEGTKNHLQKTVSYYENHEQEHNFSKIKKQQNFDTIKPTSSKDCNHKHHKLSIHDFELGSCKGQGAFGQVFPAIHKETKMLVAIKKVPKEKVKYMLDQFINEIKIQMFLDHQNLVKVYCFFDDSTHFYIIMEYMEGGNLYGLIKKNKKLTQKETAERLKEICQALKQMHDNSILHRDIKPQNIVITNDVCKVCDFGWSALCKDRRTTYCGTLDYVSPQIIGGQGYDDSVDIWCIGVLAYEMMCGKTPFYNISRKQTMKRIVDVNYQYPAEISITAREFIDKILKKDPNDRIDINKILKDKFLTK